ncbi:hypothetical protein HYW74_04275 [Candidatus Pacearchaeota archaeon]|nr:hypothetical protein [Candidatus Pacearchaeota archaeon]
MKTKKLLIFLSVLFALIIISFFLYIGSKGIFSGKATLNFKEDNGEWSDINKENFPQYLVSQQIVKDLPKDSEILLKLINDEKIIEKNYIISRNSVMENEAENPDVAITLNSKYIDELENGLCETLKKAKENNEMNFEMKLNIVSFLWKYKNEIKYKNCFN